MKFTLPLFLIALMTLPVCADGLSLAADPKGTAIKGGALGDFLLEGPTLTLEDKTSHVPTVVPGTDGTTYTLKYDTGLEIHAVISKETKTVTFSFDKIPDKGQLLAFSMRVPITFNQGGKVSLGQNAQKAIPEKESGQFVTDGSVGEFDLYSGLGGGFSITTPVSWQCLQDNRFFNDESFVWDYNYDLKAFPDKTSFDIVFKDL